MQRGRGWWLVGGLTIALLLASCGAASPTVTTAVPTATSTPIQPAVKRIAVRDAWARPTLMGASGMGTPAGGMGVPSMSAIPSMGGTPGMGGTPAMGGTSTSAAYMVISNSSSTADKLIGAASDVAAAIELHTTEVKDNVARMQQVQGIDVPANGEVQLKPGGFHIMLVNVRRDLKPGDTFTLTLTFAQAGAIDVTIQVRQP